MKELSLKKAVRLALAPIACASLLSACAPYEPYSTGYPAHVETPASAFDRLDANRDGFLSRGELDTLGIASQPLPPPETAEAAFQRLDVNRDGFLSRGEVGGTLATIPGASFEVADANRDGFLSSGEVMPHLRWLERRAPATAGTFESYDRDRDGFLNRAEAEPLLRDRVSGPRYAGPMPAFDRLDLDRDGFLTRAEAAPIANPPTFDRFDTNRDGFLSRAETDELYRSGVGGTYPASGGTVYGPR
jgi:Ca2+-binding EF-hand superfamily protein